MSAVVGPAVLAAALVVMALAALARAWAAARDRRAALARLVPGTPSSVVAARLPLVAVPVVVIVAVPGPAMAALALAGVAAAPAVAARWRRFTAAAGEADALPDVVDALAAALRAGSPPRDALRAAAAGAPVRVAAGLDAAASAADRGVPLVLALDRWAAMSELEGADLLATAVAVTSSAGGDAARALTSVGDTLRDRRSLRREVRALSSQARMSALVIAVAPVVFALVAVGSDATTADFLLRSPLGFACIALGLMLDVAGWWWMDRITRTLR